METSIFLSPEKKNQWNLLRIFSWNIAPFFAIFMRFKCDWKSQEKSRSKRRTIVKKRTLKLFSLLYTICLFASILRWKLFECEEKWGGKIELWENLSKYLNDTDSRCVIVDFGMDGQKRGGHNEKFYLIFRAKSWGEKNPHDSDFHSWFIYQLIPDGESAFWGFYGWGGCRRV